MIYFIQAVNDSEGPVKIGYTDKAPYKRLASLQTGNPYLLQIIAIANGDRDTETYLHRRFSADRMVGEWFKWTLALSETMQKNPYTKPPRKPRESLRRLPYTERLAKESKWWLRPGED